MHFRENPLLAAIVCATGLLALVSLPAWSADETLTLQHQGVARTAILHAPVTASAGPSPLVIALHGFGQTTESLRNWLPIDATAAREGFRVVYPEAVERLWGYGRPINKPMPTVGNETVDDVGFIRVLIDALVARKLADPARIYVTGLSRGGLMAFTVACALAERIAAAAPLITGMTEYQREDCKPARPNTDYGSRGHDRYGAIVRR